MSTSKTIFVTGAASGIGKATSVLFGSKGWRVGCYDIDVDGARKVAEQIPGSAHGRIDVTSEESWKTAVADFAAGSATLDVLFNCAGILRMGRFEDVGPAECRKQLDINVMGVVLGIQTCLPLLERGRGTIINMSSASAIYGQPELAVYSASKFAVRALTEALDIELRSKGVRIADIMPGYVDTPMVSSQTHKASSLKKLGVKLTPEKIASIVWDAVHGKRLHYIPQMDLEIMSRIGGLLPELGRFAMRRIGKS
jgi:NAD(P)-dependent dehydrogenase (short-subunit alcohol dehydrogenase family)